MPLKKRFANQLGDEEYPTPKRNKRASNIDAVSFLTEYYSI